MTVYSAKKYHFFLVQVLKSLELDRKHVGTLVDIQLFLSSSFYVLLHKHKQ